MNINRISSSTESCNFCKCGTLNEAKTGLDLPYDTVLKIESEGPGLSARICDKCVEHLEMFRFLENKVHNDTTIEKRIKADLYCYDFMHDVLDDSKIVYGNATACKLFDKLYEDSGYDKLETLNQFREYSKIFS